MRKPARARILPAPFPTTSDAFGSRLDATKRLMKTLERLRILNAARQPAYEDVVGDFLSFTPDQFVDMMEHGETASEAEPVEDRAETSAYIRGANFAAARKRRILGLVAHLKSEDRDQIERLIGRGEFAGVVSEHEMHEKIALIHEGAPWMGAATAEIMKAMRAETASGPGALRMPPLLLLGKPGMGKSQWARAVAEAFGAPAVEIDVGAANGAVFALAGVERGWGSASAGRLVRTLIETRVANPVVIIDEMDKAQSKMKTSAGNSLPGLYEVMKSLMEPTTARRWVCPYYQIPFDMSRVNWIMTTNSLDGMPEAFLDRVRVVRLPDPTPEQVALAGRRMIKDRIADPDDREMAEAALSRLLGDLGRGVSLRTASRAVDDIRAALETPALN